MGKKGKKGRWSPDDLYKIMTVLLLAYIAFSQFRLQESTAPARSPAVTGFTANISVDAPRQKHSVMVGPVQRGHNQVAGFCSAPSASPNPSNEVRDASKITSKTTEQALKLYKGSGVTNPEYKVATVSSHELPHPWQMTVHDPSQDEFISSAIWRGEVWDVHVARLLIEAFKWKDGSLIDCGGNIGYFSLLAASMGRKVVTFEPVQANIDRLANSALLNQWTDRFRMFKNGVSDSVTTMGIQSHASNQGGLSLGSVEAGREEVDTILLNDLPSELIEWLSPVSAVKIDVEGHEGRLLNGGIELFQKLNISIIAMELSFDTKWSESCPFYKVAQEMYAAGYQAWDLPNFPPEKDNCLDLSNLESLPPNIYWAKFSHFNAWCDIRKTTGRRSKHYREHKLRTFRQPFSGLNMSSASHSQPISHEARLKMAAEKRKWRRNREEQLKQGTHRTERSERIKRPIRHYGSHSNPHGSHSNPFASQYHPHGSESNPSSDTQQYPVHFDPSAQQQQLPSKSDAVPPPLWPEHPNGNSEYPRRPV